MVSVIFLILINHFNNIIYICSVELICTLVKLYHNIHLYHCLQLTGTRDQHWNRLTLWNLKKVLRDTQPRPMCENIRKTFVAEPPASSTAMHSRKLPAAIPEFGMFGWLCEVFTCFGHFGLWHVLVTTALVPICLASIEGLSVLQTWQKLKRRSSCDKNTMCFGSDLRLVPAVVNLCLQKKSWKNILCL